MRRAAEGVRRRLRPPVTRGIDLARELNAMFRLDTFDVVFDVGANSGQSAEAFHGLFPRADIYSFEPVSAAYRQLEAVSRSLDCVRCFRLAFGRSAGEALINTFEITQLSSICSNEGSTGGETVQLSTISNFVQDHRIPRIDFLKIDVEGYEVEVLAGARDLLQREAIPFILVEAGIDDSLGRFTPLEKLRELLRLYGYEIYAFYDQSAWPDRSNLLYVDALFVSRRVLRLLQGQDSERSRDLQASGYAAISE